MGANNSCEISRLPKDCLSHVISLTSPRDACRCSTVNSIFRSAADADAVWEQFLPSDMDHILSNSVDQRIFASKKDLYFHLCNHGILIDDGKMSFRLDRSSGAKIYVLSAARAVGISWGGNPQYWQRVPNNDSGVNYDPMFQLQSESLLLFLAHKSELENGGCLSSFLDEGCECHGYRIRIVGHSLGGSVAAVLGIMLYGRYPNLHVYSYGPLPYSI